MRVLGAYQTHCEVRSGGPKTPRHVKTGNMFGFAYSRLVGALVVFLISARHTLPVAHLHIILCRLVLYPEESFWTRSCPQGLDAYLVPHYAYQEWYIMLQCHPNSLAARSPKDPDRHTLCVHQVSRLSFEISRMLTSDLVSCE